MNCIEITNVHKEISGKPVLSDITFQVKKGDIFGLLGPNGAGKTTIIRLILGLLRPDQGTVSVLGNNVINDNRKHNIKIGFVLDKGGFHNKFSAIRNLKIYGQLSGIQGAEVEKKANELAGLFGLENRLNDPVDTYSKGMLQKLVIIRSLLHEPEILILDEVTSGIDPVMQVEIREMIQKLADSGVTILMSSHNLPEVQQLCNRILIIDKGKIKLFDDKDKLIQQEKITTMFHIECEDKVKAVLLTLIKAQDGVLSVDWAGETLFIEMNNKNSINNIYKLIIDNEGLIKSFDTKEGTLESVYLSIFKGRDELK